MDYQDHNATTIYTPLIKRLNGHGMYQLFHACFGHPGMTVMSQLHNHIDNILKLRPPPLFKCTTCTRMKLTRRSTTAAHVQEALKTNPPDTDILQIADTPQSSPSTAVTGIGCPVAGERFHMDMGFIRGTKYSFRDVDGNLVTSLDGYNSYPLVVDKATRYTWVFLAKTKTPQVEPIRTFLQTHGSKGNGPKVIQTDEGGELWGSHDFQRMVRESGYIMEPTAADASFQNGIAERPNRTLGDMMRCLLHGANLGPEYWSWALIHAVYLKNRLPHRSIPTTPYQEYTGRRPDAKYLRIFGCPIITKLSGKRPAKLDSHTATGIFLGYTATDKNVYYQDTILKKIKVTTHVIFDEAGFTVPKLQLTPIQEALQHAGQEQMCPAQPVDVTECHKLARDQDDNNYIAVKRLSPLAKLPVQGTPQSAGLDLFSAVDIIVPPGTPTKIPTDITITPPPGTYCQILSQSGLIVKENVETKGGTIDRDYTGNVTVIMVNNSNNDFHVKIGDRVAQLVTYYIQQPKVMEVTTMPDTARGDNGFGSTGIHSNPTASPQVRILSSLTDSILQSDGIKPYNI
jgi:dUTP pyrophosphatase